MGYDIVYDLFVSCSFVMRYDLFVRLISNCIARWYSHRKYDSLVYQDVLHNIYRELLPMRNRDVISKIGFL